MSDERKRILKMVGEGELDVEEANDLLKALEGEDKKVEKKPSKKRSLKIKVVENGKEKVNISIPLFLARSLSKFIPSSARDKLEDQDVDINEVLTSLEEEGEDGTLVNIEDGSDHVLITLE